MPKQLSKHTANTAAVRKPSQSMKNWPDQRVLVTGGAGFIGSALVWALNNRGCERIVVCDRLGTDEKWRNLTPLRFEDYVEADDAVTSKRLQNCQAAPSANLTPSSISARVRPPRKRTPVFSSATITNLPRNSPRGR